MTLEQAIHVALRAMTDARIYGRHAHATEIDDAARVLRLVLDVAKERGTDALAVIPSREVVP